MEMNGENWRKETWVSFISPCPPFFVLDMLNEHLVSPCKNCWPLFHHFFPSCLFPMCFPLIFHMFFINWFSKLVVWIPKGSPKMNPGLWYQVVVWDFYPCLSHYLRRLLKYGWLGGSQMVSYQFVLTALKNANDNSPIKGRMKLDRAVQSQVVVSQISSMNR